MRVGRSAVVTRVFWVVLALSFPATRGMAADDADRGDLAIVNEPARAAARSAATVVARHPLTPILDYARAEQVRLNETLRDFTCRLVKRERIDGLLQDYQFIDMRVREEVRQGDRVVRPMSIFLQFLGPASVAGRKVLYVAGQNEGKMLVRNGGKHFDYVVAKIDPRGESARKESLVPITESGFNRVLAQMIEILERHASLDPRGENTKVQRIAGAKLNGRPCTVIRIVHPTRQAGMEFHLANVFIDDELRVPLRVDSADWPYRPGGTGAVLSEYTYTNLKLNVSLGDSDFSTALVRGGK
jgi:hypothetical protein